MANKTFIQLFGFEQAAARLGEAVVIIIDMQREYLDGAVPLPDLQSAVQGAAELLAVARANHTPIFHVLNQGPKGNLLFNNEGPYYAELAEVRVVGDEKTVIKQLPNAFAGTGLQSLIDATGRKQLIIVGCTTHVCVSATTRAALDLGYQSTVVADATASRDLDDGFGNSISAATVKQVALAELRDAFAVIVKSVRDLQV